MSGLEASLVLIGVVLGIVIALGVVARVVVYWLDRLWG